MHAFTRTHKYTRSLTRHTTLCSKVSLVIQVVTVWQFTPVISKTAGQGEDPISYNLNSHNILIIVSIAMIAIIILIIISIHFHKTLAWYDDAIEVIGIEDSNRVLKLENIILNRIGCHLLLETN